MISPCYHFVKKLHIRIFLLGKKVRHILWVSLYCLWIQVSFVSKKMNFFNVKFFLRPQIKLFLTIFIFASFSKSSGTLKVFVCVKVFSLIAVGKLCSALISTFVSSASPPWFARFSDAMIAMSWSSGASDHCQRWRHYCWCSVWVVRSYRWDWRVIHCFHLSSSQTFVSRICKMRKKTWKLIFIQN